MPEEDRDETSTDDTNKTSRPSTPTGGEPSVAGDAAPARPPTKPSITAEQKSAIRELYIYETTALAACFGFPLLAAYLLHALRAQLSRPSEGLVSNYNLTIFCLASELRAFSHIFKLVQCRTLHLQRVVHKNAQELTSRSASTDTTRKLDGILERLAKLETSAPLTTTQDRNDTAAVDPVASTADKWKQEAAMVQQLRASVQPELDALNRAVRRYEKKATLLEMQVQSRFGAVEARLDDSIALAAAAARDSSASRRSAGLGLKGAIVWLVDGAIRAAFWPVNTLVRIALLPVDAATALFAAASGTSTTRESAATSTRRGAGRPGTTVLVGQPRQGGRDGVPSRVGRR